MKPYEQLTVRGQARRMRALALGALSQFMIELRDVRLLGWHTNLLFRVRAADGRLYVLRVCTPGWRTGTDLFSEAVWLQALEQDTDIGAPQPQFTPNGEAIVEAEAQGIPGRRRCTLMSWVPGTPLGKRLTKGSLYKMGVLFARMHAHGENFAPPQGFTRRKMDKILARDEVDELFSETSRGAFTAHAWEVIDRTRKQVNQAFERLYANPDGLRVIHNDLWHGNIKVYRGRLHPLDFEDTVWGYPVQDLAMAIQDLMVDVQADEFEGLLAALREGYESRMAWPEAYQGQIDTFRAGRMLWVANYVARFQREHLEEHLEWLARQFERFLEMGEIRKF